MRIRTDIPYGNACRIAVADRDGVTEVSFASDAHGGPERLWFCLRAEREARDTGRSIRFVLRHPDSMLAGLNLDAHRPVVRTANRDWERLGAGDVVDLRDGRKTVAWTAPMPSSWIDIALCYPYGIPEVEALVRETGGYWHIDEIGVSQSARPIQRLSNSYGGDPKKPGIFLFARQHSGETPGSWVLDGLMRHLAERREERLVVWVVPLTNIDGVEQGDYGKDNFPYDLNHAWGHAPMRHEVLAMQRDVERWGERCRPVFAADFHAPSGTEREGVYSFAVIQDEPPVMNPAAAVWGERISRELGADLVHEPFTRVATYTSRWTTPSMTGFFSKRGVPALCVETPYAIIRERVLTREDYRMIGARVADGIVAMATR